MKELAQFLPNLANLRKELHHHPEISGKEFKTAYLLHQFLRQFSPSHIIDKIGKTGIAFIFQGENPGKTVLIRAEMDALHLEEEIDVPYSSERKSLSHTCGHDGHMAMVAGLGFFLNRTPPRSGRVILLFQPAEETGKGALAVLNDSRFKKITPDYVFALHNLPGYPHHSIIVRDGTFALASEGLSIRLKGHTAHAAYPEQGISPLPAVMELLKTLPQINKQKQDSPATWQLSITHMNLGKSGYSTIPGNALINLTLRADTSRELDILHSRIKKITAKTALKYYLEENIQRWEPFDATINDPAAVSVIRKAARRNRFTLIEPESPMRWSEDFCHFTARFTGALFGLGAGENQSDLHTRYYDFPDEIIETGVTMFYSIIRELLND